MLETVFGARRLSVTPDFGLSPQTLNLNLSLRSFLFY